MDVNVTRSELPTSSRLREVRVHHNSLTSVDFAIRIDLAGVRGHVLHGAGEAPNTNANEIRIAVSADVRGADRI